MKASMRVWTVSFAVLILLSAGFVFGQGQTAPPASLPDAPPSNDAPADQRFRLAVEVELVNLIATIVDENNRYVGNLAQGDFQVFEDGKPQNVSFFSHDEKVPVSVGVLIDNSGSMRHKIQQALQMVREIAVALAPEDEMFIVTFGSNVEVRQKFTRNIQDVQRALRGIKANGETASYDAIDTGLQEMRSAKNNKKILIQVTDGFDTRSKMNASQVEELLKRSQTLLYSIGIDDDDTDPLAQRRTRYHIYHFMLDKLSRLSGGTTYRMYTGRNYPMQSIAQTIIEELHQQYTLSYYPSVQTGTTWRNVEVKLTRPNLKIRTRPGYYVTGSSN
jgi:Ca-activated chloride channel homolog